MAARLITHTMKAIRIARFGGLEALKLENNIAIPRPKDTEILVRCEAAGVNPVDTYIRSGDYGQLPELPFTLGKDGAGVIEALGSKVTKFKIRDRVCVVSSSSGSYAQYFTADEMYVFRLHDNLNYQEGAALSIPYGTAYRALVIRCQARAGQTVLIHGASGAVGIASCQIAHALGLRVVGTAGTPQGMQLVKDNGAELVYNHREEGYTDKILEETGGVDIVVEMLANVNLAADCALCKYHGHIAIIGSRGSLQFAPRLFMGKEVNVHGVALMTSPKEDLRQTESFLYNGQALGWLKPVVGKVYPLADSVDAQRDVIEHSGGTYGKLVLDLSQ